MPVKLRPTVLRSVPGTSAAGTTLVERPFIDELRAVEKLLPIPPDEINRRVLHAHLADADLDAAERLSEMNLRYYDSVVRPLLEEWRSEVRLRRIGQTIGFVASCGALAAGAFRDGTTAYVFFFVGTFGFCTAIAAWFGSSAAGIGARVAARVGQRTQPPDGGAS